MYFRRTDPSRDICVRAESMNLSSPPLAYFYGDFKAKTQSNTSSTKQKTICFRRTPPCKKANERAEPKSIAMAPENDRSHRSLMLDIFGKKTLLTFFTGKRYIAYRKPVSHKTKANCCIHGENDIRLARTKRIIIVIMQRGKLLCGY